MLDFSAEAFFQISSVLTKFTIRPETAHSPEQMNELFDCVQDASKYCTVLGLHFSATKGGEIMNMLVTGQANPERLRYGLQEFHSRILEELRAEWFKHIPHDKMYYANRSNFERPELTAFGWVTVCEFQSAGECFAFGKYTACVFHLFRIVDAGLKSAAKKLDVDYSDGNWKTVSTKIEREMQKQYQDKTTDWREAEPFYAGILTDILAISKARNRALHDFKSTYVEEEAQRLFVIVDGFICHLSAGGLQEP